MLRTCGRGVTSLVILLCSQFPDVAVSINARSHILTQLKPGAGEECRIPLTPTSLRTMSGCNGKETYSTLRSGDCTSTKWVMNSLPACMAGQDGSIKITYKSDESEKRVTTDSMEVLVDSTVKGTWTNTNCTSSCSGFVAWGAENKLLTVQAQSGSIHGDTHMSIDKMSFIPGLSSVPQEASPPVSKVAAAPTELPPVEDPNAAVPAPAAEEEAPPRAAPGGAVAKDPGCTVPLTPSSLRTASGCNAKVMYKTLRTGDCTSTKWTSREIPACMSGLDGLINITYISDESERREISDWMQVLVDDGIKAQVMNTDCNRGCSVKVPWTAKNERLMVQAKSSTGRGEYHMSIEKMQFIPAEVQSRPEEDIVRVKQTKEVTEKEAEEGGEEELDEDEAWREEDEEAQKRIQEAKKRKAAKAAAEAAAAEGAPKKREEAKVKKAASTASRKQTMVDSWDETEVVPAAPRKQSMVDSGTKKEAAVNDVSAKGDPHVTNVNGDRYDIQQHGPLTLLLLPRGAAKNRALLRVWALTKGTLCGPKYIDKLIVAGRWVEEKKHVGKTGEVENRWLYHTNEEWSNPESPYHRQHASLGPGVELVISHGKTDTGVLYLNFQAHQLARAGVSVGGLLGDDDHGWAAAQPELCARSLALNSRRSGTEGCSMSTLLATLD